MSIFIRGKDYAELENPVILLIFSLGVLSGMLISWFAL